METHTSHIMHLLLGMEYSQIFLFFYFASMICAMCFRFGKKQSAKKINVINVAYKHASKGNST